MVPKPVANLLLLISCCEVLNAAAQQEIQIPREVRQQLRSNAHPFHYKLASYVSHLNAPYLSDPVRREAVMTDESSKLGLEVADMEKFIVLLSTSTSPDGGDSNLLLCNACASASQGTVFSNEEAKTMVETNERNSNAEKAERAASLLSDISREYGEETARAVEIRVNEWGGTSMSSSRISASESVELYFDDDYPAYIAAMCALM